MKSFPKLTIAFVITLFFSINSKAQKDYSKDADNAFKNREYFNAIELYKKAYGRVKPREQKAAIIFKTAECYRMIGDSKQAEVWYYKAIKTNYPDPKATLYLADAKKSMEKYDEAIAEYNKYKQAIPSDNRGEDGAKSSGLAEQWKKKPTRYKVENMVMINTKDPDFAPCYADKKYKKIYFTSMRPGGIGDATDPTIGQNFSDIFETTVDKNGKWSTPVSIITPVNTEHNEGLSTISKKGDLMVFTRCIVEKKKETFNQLWQCKKEGNEWGEPTKLQFCNDSLKFGSPSISADGQRLFFSSNLSGGQGDNDIWMVQRDKKTKRWGVPVNLGPAINTPGNDAFPFIHDDGTLYFSSNAHLGMGGLDIFKAESKGDGQWGNVTNMKYPINSAGDDFGIIFEEDKDRGYFSSNREGTKGADDIWSFVLPPICCIFEGYITDCEFKGTVPGVIVKLSGSDGSLTEVKTDADGYYKFTCPQIKSNISYIVSTQVGATVVTLQAPLGFFSSPEKFKFTTVGLTEDKMFKKDFCLPPIKPTENRFPDVLYLTDKYDLEHPSKPKDSLDILYQTLIDNPTYVIELSSHTDYRSSNKYNIELSQKRAQACVDYLISKGIHPSRLKAAGYGEGQPLEVDTNKDKKIDYKLTKEYIDKTTKFGKPAFNKDEYEALMQKNRRTVFSVIRKDFVDPNANKDVLKTEPVKEEG